MNFERQKYSEERSETSNTSTPKSSASPYSTPSPHSPHSPSFRENPINPELLHNTSVLGLDPEVISHRFQTSSASSISSPSSLTSSSNPLTSSLPASFPSLPKPPKPPITVKPVAKMTGFTPTALHELPIPGSKFAPAKFTGKYHRAKRFTDHYKKLIKGINGIKDEEKCQSMMQYCSTKVSDFLEQLTSYRTNDFDQLIKDIHNYYDVQLAESRWKEKNLIKFVKQYQSTKIRTLSQWKAYNRRYLRIANWLLNQKLVDDAHYRAYFWDGINKELQREFETLLRNKATPVDFTKPFPLDDVQKVAEQYFMRDRFATLVADSDNTDSDSESFESTDDENSSGSSDSESDYKKKKKHAKSHTKTKRKMDYYRKKLQAVKEEKEDSRSKHEPESSSKKDPKSSEIDDLIDQLQKMSVDNPAYGITYYKATKLDKNLIDCLKKPMVQTTPTVPTYQEKKKYKPGQAVFHLVQALPATESNAIPITEPQAYFAKNQLFNPTGDDRCFGCGGRGHPIRGCQKITELLNAGIVKRSQETGRLFMQDGTPIRKMQTETLAQAAERMAEEQQAMSAQCAMIRPVTLFCDTVGECDSDEESDYEFEQSQQYQNDESEGEYYTDEELSDDEYELEEDADWEDVETHEDLDTHQIYKLLKQVYEIGPEKSSRQTRSTRQRVADKFSTLPRGVTDKMKKNILKNKEEAEEMPVPVPVKSSNVKTQPSEIEQPRMTTRSQVPVQLDEDIIMQEQAPQPKPVSQKTEQSNIQPSASTSKYPSGLKPYVELPSRIRKVPASEPKKESAIRKTIPQIIPTNARTPRKVQLPDDEEGISRPTKPLKKISRPKYEEEKENRRTQMEQQAQVVTARRPGRKSELSSIINDRQIINKLLDASVPLKISEILAVSPRVANSVSDLMKPKNQASLKIPATYEMSTNPLVNLVSQRPLIKVLLKTDGGPLNAIVDTGSQINVVNKKHCGTVIKQPIKLTPTVGMQDASGRHSKLSGVIHEVPLDCGSVKTSASLYVGENLPFDLLLGRPWQKGNRISIDERNDGTYLVFNHPTDSAANMELLVDNSSADSSQMARQAMTSMVFAINETLEAAESAETPESVNWHPQIASEVTDWWLACDLSGWQCDKITENHIDGSAAVITDGTAKTTGEMIAGHHPVPKMGTTMKERRKHRSTMPSGHYAPLPIMLQMQRIMEWNDNCIVRQFLRMQAAICNKRENEVFKEKIHNKINRPPVHSIQYTKMCDIYTEQSFLYAKPITQLPSRIKPLSLQQPNTPSKLDFTSRIEHASDYFLERQKAHTFPVTSMYIAGEYNVPQTLEQDTTGLVNGTILGAGFYQEDQNTGQRALLGGDMTYSFLPTCQYIFDDMTCNGGWANASKQEKQEPERGVRVTRGNPWMGIRDTVSETLALSSSSSESVSGSLTSSDSLNSLLNAGPLRQKDILAAQERVITTSNRKSASPLCDDYINWESDDNIPTQNVYPNQVSCSPVIRTKDLNCRADSDSPSDDVRDDYDYIYGPRTPELKPKVLPITENIPPPHNSPDIIPTVDSKPSQVAEWLVHTQATPTQMLRDDTPHPITGKVFLDHGNKAAPSPPIENPPFPAEGKELIAYYQILLAESKRRDDEQAKREKEVKDEDDDMPMLEYPSDEEEDEYVNQNDNIAEVTEMNKRDLDKTCTACTNGNTTHSIVPCTDIDSLLEEADRKFAAAQNEQKADPPIIKIDWRSHDGICCKFHPHSGQAFAHRALVKAVQNNAFTETHIGGVEMYQYLYDRGGWELVIQEATDVRKKLLNYIHSLLGEVTEWMWKTKYGRIRKDYYRSFQGIQEYRLDPHYVLPIQYEASMGTPKNPFLFPAEEVSLCVAKELFLERNCFLTAAKIDEVLGIKSPFESIIRQWLQHGLLNLESLIRLPDYYTPAALIEFEECDL